MSSLVVWEGTPIPLHTPSFPIVEVESMTGVLCSPSPLQCVGLLALTIWVKTVARMGIDIAWDGYQTHTRHDDTKGILHLE